MHAAQAMAQPGDPRLVEQRSDRGGHGRQCRGRAAEGVADDGTLAVAPDECTGVERLQVERCHVELAVHLGVGGERHLEAAVEGEAVDVIGAHTTADAVARLVHLDRDPRLVQRHGARQACQPGADDGHRLVGSGDRPGHFPSSACSAVARSG
jgi:hypothetical protein